MFQLHEIPTRFTSPAASAWCGTHKLCHSRRYRTEDDALRAICERVAALTMVVRREPEFNTDRNEQRVVVVRCFGITWVVRRAD